MKSRLEVAEDERPPTPCHLTTLHIKTEDGEQVKPTVAVATLSWPVVQIHCMYMHVNLILTITMAQWAYRQRGHATIARWRNVNCTIYDTIIIS